MNLHEPRAARIPVRNERFGINWTDHYAWLRDPAYPDVKDEEVLDYLRAENALFNHWRDGQSDTIDKIYDELIGRIKKDDSSVPVRDDGYDYQWRFAEHAQYRSWYRRPNDVPDFALLLDENKLAEGAEYFNLGGFSVSAGNKLLAFAIDKDGSERYRVFVRDLGHTDVADREVAMNCSGSIVWAGDDSGFFYVELSESHRPYRVRFHRLAKDLVDDDQIVYEESDPAFFVGIGLTSDWSYVVIQSGTHETGEARLIERSDPLQTPRLVRERISGVDYSLDSAHGDIFVVINDNHQNFRLVTVPSGTLDFSASVELIAPCDTSYLTSCRCFHDFIVVSERHEGLKQIRVMSYDGAFHRPAFDEEAYTVTLGDNREFSSHAIRLSYSSMTTPASVLDYDVKARTFEVLKEQEIPSGYDRSLYLSHRLTVPGRDGVEIPVSLVHHKDYPFDGERKLLLNGYGAYGMGLYPSFSPSRLSLLDRGFAFAIAHIRGGDEMGYDWYESGKKDRKVNSFNDFIAAADGLIGAGYAEAGRIAIMGGSAGGMLMGAVSNMRPDLWQAVVAQVPFVDVLHTMLDESLPLTPIEWPEWGNPIESEEDFRRILSYSPYDNLKAQAYPAMLVTAGISDPRVTYWEPAKYVARLRELRTNQAPLYLKTNMGAGHFGVSGRFDSLKELAEVYAFLIDSFKPSAAAAPV